MKGYGFMTTTTLKKQLANEMMEALDIAIERGGDIVGAQVLKFIASERRHTKSGQVTKVLDRLAEKIKKCQNI